MPAERSCAVEGCDAGADGYLRFLDSPHLNKEDGLPCPAHLGHGLILRVDLCKPHRELAQRHGGDGTRWEG